MIQMFYNVNEICFLPFVLDSNIATSNVTV